GPVIVKPFSSSAMFGAPNAMHGPPVTVHVTSPTKRVFSDRIRVLTTVPLISSAAAAVPVSDMAPARTEPTASLESPFIVALLTDEVAVSCAESAHKASGK